MDVLSRRSRLFRQPTGKPVLLSPRDIEIFKLLNRYRFLRSSFIGAFFPAKSPKSNGLLKRLGDLFHERPHYLSRPKQQYGYANANYLPAVYELSDIGRQVLKLEGVNVLAADHQIGNAGESRNFAHALMICDILASIELGCKNYTQGLDSFVSTRFVTCEEILHKAPCRALEFPFRIPVSLEGKEMSIIPDGLFGLEYTDQHISQNVARTPKSYRFFALEADRQTMPIFRKSLSQTSYRRKLLCYREILSKEIYKTHFGIPNLFVLNVTTSADRLEHIKQALLQLTGGKGNSVFLFKTMKGDLFTAPPADEHMMTKPWVRAGYPMFKISAVEGEVVGDYGVCEAVRPPRSRFELAR